jgi:hypothetical protein
MVGFVPFSQKNEFFFLLGFAPRSIGQFLLLKPVLP